MEEYFAPLQIPQIRQRQAPLGYISDWPQLCHLHQSSLILLVDVIHFSSLLQKILFMSMPQQQPQLLPIKSPSCINTTRAAPHLTPVVGQSWPMTRQLFTERLMRPLTGLRYPNFTGQKGRATPSSLVTT
jgi:hypothetical protein